MASSVEQGKNKIFILDDEAIVREALRTILDVGGYKAVCFAHERDLLEATRRRCPAGIFLDVFLPGRSGLEILDDLADCPAPVLMLSGQGDIPMAVEAMKHGAVDFIQKPFTAKDILDRLERILSGYSGRSCETLAQRVSSMNFPGREPLSRRERDVLRFLVAGSSNKEAAEALGLSYRTVEEHRSHIMLKLGVKNIAQLLNTVLK